MNLQLKIKLLFITLFLSFCCPKVVAAQVPPPTVKCNDIDTPEFQSLRPYQASPCKKQATELARYCGSSLVFSDSVSAHVGTSPRLSSNCTNNGDKTYRCTYTTHKTTPINVLISGATLPILGNTQDTVNSQSQTDSLDEAVKVNEYVSWYLNGVNGRAEDFPLSMDSATDSSMLVDFSGPLNKLLPQEKQDDFRANTVNKAVRSRTQDAGIRHDQVIGCTYEIFGFGKIPGPCYESGFRSLIPRVEQHLSAWKGHFPPKASDYPDYVAWWADYERWRGKFCFTPTIPSWVPVIGGKTILFCGEDPFSPNYYASLWKNIPFSSTEDRVGNVSIGSSAVSSTPDVKITNVNIVQNKAATQYFAHTEEAAELASLLQLTFVPQGNPQTGSGAYLAPPENCDLTTVRSNPGDDLFKDTLSGQADYDIEFSCNFSANALAQDCSKNVNVGIGVVTNTPKANEIWERLVAGPSSAFKRIFPLLGGNGGLGGIMDIPAASKVTYTASNLASVTNPSSASDRPTELYFPHLGGVSEYFLKGIQTMLRPKGYGEPIIFGGMVTTASCGNSLGKYSPPGETTAKAKEYFQLYIQPRLTADLMSVYAQAEAATGVPCEILAGVHFVEANLGPDQSLQNGGPLNGRSLLDSAIQAGNEIKAKVGGSFSDLNSIITALSRYNGGGNSNCGRDARYRGPCPPPEGLDDPYATSWIDPRHETMFLIYCWDHIQCPKPFQELIHPGSLTVAIELYNSTK